MKINKVGSGSNHIDSAVEMTIEERLEAFFGPKKPIPPIPKSCLRDPAKLAEAGINRRFIEPSGVDRPYFCELTHRWHDVDRTKVLRPPIDTTRKTLYPPRNVFNSRNSKPKPAPTANHNNISVAGDARKLNKSPVSKPKKIKPYVIIKGIRTRRCFIRLDRSDVSDYLKRSAEAVPSTLGERNLVSLAAGTANNISVTVDILKRNKGPMSKSKSKPYVIIKGIRTRRCFVRVDRSDVSAYLKRSTEGLVNTPAQAALQDGAVEVATLREDAAQVVTLREDAAQVVTLQDASMQHDTVQDASLQRDTEQDAGAHIEVAQDDVQSKKGAVAQETCSPPKVTRDWDPFLPYVDDELDYEYD